MNLSRGKFIIVAGSKATGIERLALDRLRKHIHHATGARPEVKTDWEIEDAPGLANMIVLGSTETNSITRILSEQGAFIPETREQGYALKTIQNPDARGKWVLLIAGKDEQGTLYGVIDLCHYHLEKKNWDVLVSQIDVREAPTMKMRGFFDWDYYINDPYRYFDRMSEWKLNTMCIWNEQYLMERRDVIPYAHSRGIKIVMGVGIHSWGTIGIAVHTGSSWLADAAPKELKRSADGFVLCPSEETNQQWMREYIRSILRELDGLDGIYYQTGIFDFDDCACEKCRALTIGERLVMQLNLGIDAAAEERPDLWISYGIHVQHLRNKEIYSSFNKIRGKAIPMLEGGYPFLSSDDQRNVNELMPGGIEYGYVRPHLYMQGQMIQGWRERRGKWIHELLERINTASTLGVKNVLALVSTPEFCKRPLYLPIVFSEVTWNARQSSEEFSRKLMKIRKIADLDQRVSDPPPTIVKKGGDVLLIKRMEGTREEGGWIWGHLRVNAWLKADVCDLLSENESTCYTFDLPPEYENGLTRAGLIIHGARDDVEEYGGNYRVGIWINDHSIEAVTCSWKKGKKMIHKDTEPHNELCKPCMFLNLSDWEVDIPVKWLSSKTRITLALRQDDGLLMYNKMTLRLCY